MTNHSVTKTGIWASFGTENNFERESTEGWKTIKMERVASGGTPKVNITDRDQNGITLAPVTF